jgi:preprotein translocase YajC subunit
MCRSVFAFLILPCLLWNASEIACAQEVESGQQPMPAVSNPSMGGVETNNDLADLEPPKTTNLAGKVPAKKLSGVEEFFASPLNYFLVLIVCVYVYLMFIQPKGARKERLLQATKLSNLKKNDRVVTTAGIHGIVSSINSEAGTITLRVDENTNAKLTIDRESIRSIAS